MHYNRLSLETWICIFIWISKIKVKLLLYLRIFHIDGLFYRIRFENVQIFLWYRVDLIIRGRSLKYFLLRLKTWWDFYWLILFLLNYNWLISYLLKLEGILNKLWLLNVALTLNNRLNLRRQVKVKWEWPHILCLSLLELSIILARRRKFKLLTIYHAISNMWKLLLIRQISIRAFLNLSQLRLLLHLYSIT